MCSTTININGYTIEIIPSEDAQSPRSEDYGEKVDTMVCFHNKYFLGDKEHGYKKEDFNTWDELGIQIIKDHNPIVIKPLYLYDHSGITISTNDFHDRWDSGQVGFIFISRQKALKNWQMGKYTNTRYLIPKVEKYLKASIEEYDLYIRGDCYGYSIKKDGEEIDSRWGYFGFEYCKEKAMSIVNAMTKKDVPA